MAEAAPVESHVVGACSGLESTLRFLKAFKSLNSFRDFQAPLGKHLFLRSYDDIEKKLKSLILNMKRFEHVVSGAPRRVHGGSLIGLK